VKEVRLCAWRRNSKGDPRLLRQQVVTGASASQPLFKKGLLRGKDDRSLFVRWWGENCRHSMASVVMIDGNVQGWFTFGHPKRPDMGANGLAKSAN
jgi:hypothetical protein